MTGQRTPQTASPQQPRPGRRARLERYALLAGGLPVVAAAAGGWLLLGRVEHPPRAATAPRPARCGAPDGSVQVPAGDVMLGEDGEGRPGRKVHVPAFGIDVHEVANREFAAFVAATGYKTRAERDGGAVFVAPGTLPNGLNDPSQWWKFVRGANWRHPTGPASTIEGRMEDPVVQVVYDDALAYARWKGRALPTEAQWERAARGEQAGMRSPTSWAYTAAGKPKANTWQGVFPVVNTGEDGFDGLSPVGCFEPNSLGLYDMIGNAWEWTTAQSGKDRVIKGGSFLCSMHYCANFRPAGWQAQEADLPTSHVGFRTATGASR